jgi:LmbE family N-acetylglucosaminyl deacetylase
VRVLCLGAHPDDIEIGCAGTLERLRRRGAAIHLAVFSGNPIRAREAARSARMLLGASRSSRLVLHGFRDGFFPAQFAEIKEVCEELAARIKPDVVFTHHRDDRHQDHRLLSDVAWNTFRHHLVLEYEVPKWDGDLGQPNIYVPLSGPQAERKIRILTRAFASQAAKPWFDARTFRGVMRLRGVECRSPSGMAEAFHGRKLTLDFARVS